MAQFTRKYTVHNAGKGIIEGTAIVDDEEVQFTKQAVTVELIPDRATDGTLKIVLTGGEKEYGNHLEEGREVQVTFNFKEEPLVKAEEVKK